MTTLKHRKIDLRTEKVLGFFVGKGLLWTNLEIKPFYGKLLVNDVLWVAENIEPRVYEVLPAALIHFPKTFIGKGDLPDQFQEIVSIIQKGREMKIKEWKGIQTSRMLKWVNKQLIDKRAKPLNQRKQNKTFRFHPKVIRKLKALVEKHRTNETAYLEFLIHRAAS